MIIKHFNRLFKYIFVGGSAAIINWCIFYLSVSIHIHYLIGGVISFVIATLWNFMFARIFVFRESKYSLFKEGILIYVVSLGGFILDISLLYICVDFFYLHEMQSKIIATFIVFIFNFSLRNFVIYKNES